MMFLLMIALLSLASMAVDNQRNTTALFFFASLPLNAPLSDGIQSLCRTACANTSHDANHLGGYVAWILSLEENNAVFELTSSLAKQPGVLSYFVLGGNRRTQTGGTNGKVWYWTEFPAQMIAHNQRGLPFYNGTSEAGRPLRYTNFTPGEPNNALDTQLVFTNTTGMWNDLSDTTLSEVGGCICRRWATPSRTPTVEKTRTATHAETAISLTSSKTNSEIQTDTFSSMSSASVSCTAPTQLASSTFSPEGSSSGTLTRISLSGSPSNTLSSKTRSGKTSLTESRSSCPEALAVSLYSLGTPLLSDAIRSLVAADLAYNKATLISSERVALVPDVAIRQSDAHFAPLALLHSEPRSWQMTQWTFQHYFAPLAPLREQLSIDIRTNCSYDRATTPSPSDGVSDEGLSSPKMCLTFLFSQQIEPPAEAMMENKALRARH
jgi:hypothetical protein